MKVERLWLRKQYILLARNDGGSPLVWLNEPLCQLGGWIQATNELNEQQPKKQPEKLPSDFAGGKAREILDCREADDMGVALWHKSSILLILF